MPYTGGTTQIVPTKFDIMSIHPDPPPPPTPPGNSWRSPPPANAILPDGWFLLPAKRHLHRMAAM